MAKEDLKPFKKGEKRAKELGAKGGRAKKGHVSIKATMKRLLDSGEIDVNKLSQSLFLHAMKGNSGIAKLILEYVDGKVKDEIEHSGDFSNNITIEFVKPKKDK